MGWRDRDYARWTPEERRRFLGPTPSGAGRRGGGVRVSQGIAGAAAISVILLALGHFPSGHPLVPALHFGGGSSVAPGSAPLIRGPVRPTVRLTGPSRVPVHSLLTFHGPVPPGDEGTVRVLGSLNGSRWRTLAVADGSGGSYLARVAVNKAGLLRLRLVFRDGSQAAETIRVG